MHFCVSTLATALVGALAVKAAPSLPRSTGSSDLTNPKACALTGSNISVVRHDGGHVTNETNVTQYDILWGNTSKKNPPCKGDPVFAIGLVKKGAKRPDSIVSLDWVSGGLAVQGNDFETLLAMPGTSPGEYSELGLLPHAKELETCMCG